MLLKSKIHNIHYIRPIGLWFFINLLFFPAYAGEWEVAFCFIAISSTIVFTIASVHHARKPEMIITDDLIIYKTKLPNIQEEYRLSTIQGFNWNGSALGFHRSYGPSVRLNNSSFELTFEGGESLAISADQYSNFEEIRNFFYQYCIKHKIVDILPLDERKKRRWLNRYKK